MIGKDKVTKKVAFWLLMGFIVIPTVGGLLLMAVGCDSLFGGGGKESSLFLKWLTGYILTFAIEIIVCISGVYEVT